MNNKIIVISGADRNRYNAFKNHKKYCVKHSIDYQFHYSENLPNPYFTKCYAILDSFKKGYDKVLWVDDDVFFINLAWNCNSIYNQYTEEVIVTQGRTNKKSGTTLFNNGIMFIRNTPAMYNLFSSIPKIKKITLKENWNKEWGPCEGNDQPRMIYYTQTYFPEKVKILPYPGFNAHEITFKQQKNFLETKPPFVHITGQNKKGKLERFRRNTGINLP